MRRRMLYLGGVIVVFAGAVLVPRRESAIAKAHRLCGDCGLAVEEIDGLIRTMAESPLDRAVLLESFYLTFPNRADGDVCWPCAEAVLDAAAELGMGGNVTR